MEVLRTLAALDAAAARRSAEAFLDEKDARLQGAALEVLGTHPAGAKLIGERFLAKKLPRERLPQVADILYRFAARNPELAQMRTDVLRGGLLLSLDPAEVERVRRLVRTKGNPQRGMAIYLNNQTLACVTCHRLEGVGGHVGPDLTRLWDTHSVEKIMESIIDPSKEIKEGYQTYVATTKKGQVFAGLKIAQNATEVTLRDVNAKDIRIPTADLEELTVSPKSLMPENAVANLSFEQFIDLVAFLKDRAAQESLRGIALDFWVVGPFKDDLKTAYPPEADPEPTATYPGEKPGDKLVWHAQQAEGNGFLNLRATCRRDHASAYVLTYIYAPKAQKTQMLVGSDGRMRVWLNGNFVHEHATARSAQPDQDQLDITLQEGWNKVLIKVVSETADQRLYLRVAGGEGLRVSAKPDDN
jgi:putative heme-binding domain-containing protein